MSDDPKDAPVTTAPNVISDRVWDADKLPDGMLHNLGFDPIPVPDTKQDYMRLLAERGLRMKDQQESTMPDVPLLPEREKRKPQPAPELTEGACRIIRAFSRVLDRYGVQEELWCDLCFERGLGGGCRLRYGANGRGLSIACGCSMRRYVCTTELTYTRADALTTLDQTVSAIVDAHGQHVVPTTLIQDDDAKITLRYINTLRALKLNNSIRCRGCHDVCEVTFSDTEIVMLCRCHNRYWKGVTH